MSLRFQMFGRTVTDSMVTLFQQADLHVFQAQQTPQPLLQQIHIFDQRQAASVFLLTSVSQHLLTARVLPIWKGGRRRRDVPGTHTRDTKNMQQLLARHTRNTTVWTVACVSSQGPIRT